MRIFKKLNFNRIIENQEIHRFNLFYGKSNKLIHPLPPSPLKKKKEKEKENKPRSHIFGYFGSVVASLARLIYSDKSLRQVPKKTQRWTDDWKVWPVSVDYNCI